MYGIILVVVLAAMGGAIAFIGDKLGTKVGKKKLSIFGLRPKHTSIIVTIITGILITASTLGAMALVSENVRVALFGMEKLNAQIRLSQQNLQDVSLLLKNAELERAKTITALNEAQADYKKAVADLNRSHEEVGKLQAAATELSHAKSQLDAKVSELSQERSRLESDVDRLRELTLNLSKSMQLVREGEIVYRADEIVLNTILPYQSQNDADKIAASLVNVLNEANTKVLERLNVQEPVDVIWLSRSAFNDAVAAINAQKQDVIIRVLSAGNIVYGEPVPVELELYPNKLLYKKGQFIYQETFNTAQNSAGSEQIVIEFLHNINATATAQGIIPDPIRGSVGVLNGAEFYSVANSVAGANRSVTLTATAAEDTYTLGPLRPHIKVTPSSDEEN